MSDSKEKLLWMLNEERSDNASDLPCRQAYDSEKTVLSEKSGPKIGAAILSAGYSSRMNDFKPLLQIGGISALERIIYTMKIAGISEIAVVTGYRAEELEPVIYRENIICAHNPDFSEGMFTSVRAGVRAMKACDTDGFFLIPVDTPMVEIDTVKELLKKAESLSDDREMLCPTYYGKKGHPLYIPSAYYDEILSHDGKGGLKAVTEKYDEKLCRYPVESEGVILDMDDPAGYREILEYYENGCEDERLSDLSEEHRFFLVRHGEIEQHEEKIFLGQTDVPLSRRGREQAAEAGRKLSSYPGIDVSHIYTSDLLRAEDTAEKIAEALDILDVRPVRAFREMSLGEWDGRFISEIKKEYPDEYERRGRDLFRFKFGNRCENFYDLQYRVIKELKRILKAEEKGSDLMIVAHSGVLRVITNALSGKDVSDDYDKLSNGEFEVIEK